jgi:hypothetical protein
MIKNIKMKTLFVHSLRKQLFKAEQQKKAPLVSNVQNSKHFLKYTVKKKLAYFFSALKTLHNDKKVCRF